MGDSVNTSIVRYFPALQRAGVPTPLKGAEKGLEKGADTADAPLCIDSAASTFAAGMRQEVSDPRMRTAALSTLAEEGRRKPEESLKKKTDATDAEKAAQTRGINPPPFSASDGVIFKGGPDNPTSIACIEDPSPSGLVETSISSSSAAAEAGRRETVFDGKVSIRDGIELDIPDLPPLCDSIEGLTKKMVDIGDCMLHVEEQGSGIPIVLLSGGPGTTHHSFHPHFSAAGDFGRVIYYDQRGTGSSGGDPTGEKYSLKQAVDDLESLRKALKIERWIVLGHSYGGMLAQAYVLQYPESTRGLVLVASSPGIQDPDFWKSRYGDLFSKEESEKFGEICRARNVDGAPLSTEQRVYNMFLNGDWKRQYYYKPSDEDVAWIARYGWKPLPGFQKAMNKDLFNFDLRGKFDNFPVPTLLMESRNDLTWQSDKAERMMENHPDAEMALFERSNHHPFAEEPEKFFARLRDFVEKVKDASPTQELPSGDRMEWPPYELQRRIEKLPGMGAEAEAGEILKEAVSVNLHPLYWDRICSNLFFGRRYEQCLQAWKSYADNGSDMIKPMTSFISQVWQGHIHDLLGEREEALACYREAQRLDIGDSYGNPRYGSFRINGAWISERLGKPFDMSMVSPPAGQ